MFLIDESPARVLVNSGALALGRGEVLEAERLFREAVAADPANPTAHANLGYVLAASGRHREGIACSEAAIALDPTVAAPWAHLGMSQIALGDVTAGLASLATAVRLDPENHFAWDALGRTYLALGCPADAERAWARAVDARPDDVDLRIARATALAAQDRTREARLGCCMRRRRWRRSSARAWTQLGVVSLVRQDHGTAGEALLTALDLEPDDADAQFHLAVLHVLVGAVRGGARGAGGAGRRRRRVGGRGGGPARAADE